MLLKHEGPAAYVKAQPIFLYPADWLAKNAERAAQEEAHGLAHFQGADTLRRRIAALLAFDATPHLTGIHTPTLISAARDDALVPCSMSEQLAAAIPSAQLHVAPWGAHAINVTEPDAFNAMLLQFLAALDRAHPARS
jgi:aminoacrylate hydrolase